MTVCLPQRVFLQAVRGELPVAFLQVRGEPRRAGGVRAGQAAGLMGPTEPRRPLPRHGLQRLGAGRSSGHRAPSAQDWILAVLGKRSPRSPGRSPGWSPRPRWVPSSSSGGHVLAPLLPPHPWVPPRSRAQPLPSLPPQEQRGQGEHLLPGAQLPHGGRDARLLGERAGPRAGGRAAAGQTRGARQAWGAEQQGPTQERGGGGACACSRP